VHELTIAESIIAGMGREIEKQGLSSVSEMRHTKVEKLCEGET